jgi:hypothetical protein
MDYGADSWSKPAGNSGSSEKLEHLDDQRSGGMIKKPKKNQTFASQPPTESGS